MTWEKIDRDTYPLRYGESDDGTVWVDLSSLVAFMGHLARQFDASATRLGTEDADEVLIAGHCGASHLATQLQESFTLFGMDCDLSREPVPVTKRPRRGHR